MRQIRLKLDTKNCKSCNVTDSLTGKAPKTWRANATDIEVGVFNDGTPVDLTGYTELELVIRPDRTTATNLAYKTLATPDSNTITSNGWDAGTDQHATFSLTDAEINLDLGSKESVSYWLAVTGLDASGNETTFGVTWLTVEEDNNAVADPPPSYPGSGITEDEADARYIPKSQIDAKGDIITGTADDTPSTLPVGTDGQVLSADSTEASGLKWVSAGAGSGDMLAATYDPNTVAADAFDMDNMVEGATTKILTATERAEIAANTAAQHAAVTVSDSAEIDLTLTGQDISASIVASSIDETKLDASVNASLDLADSALQSADIDTLAELNAIVGDATLDSSSDPRTPTSHASSHTNGTDDIQDATAAQKGLATAAQITKLDGIESNATADQTGAEIKSLYEAEAKTNAFTDAEQSKLAGLWGGANKLDATTAPTANSDSANTDGNGTFSVGSVWIDTTADEAYRCADATATAAVWVNTSLESGDLAAVALSGSASDLTTGTLPIARIGAGNITENELNASINASLDLADSASQPGHPHTASEVTDFDTEVSNNTTVAGNEAYTPRVLSGTAKTATFTAVIGETHLINTSGSGFTANLPAISGGQGRIAFYFTGTGNSLTIDPSGAEQIGGKNTLKLDHGHNTIENDGTEWKLIQRSGVTPNRLDPAQITSNQDGYNPTDWGHGVTHLYIDSDASREIQGFEEDGFHDMEQIVVTNDGSNDIIIKHDTAPTLAHRVIVDGGSDFTLGANQTGILMRDGTANRWRFYAISNPAGSGDVFGPIVSTDNALVRFNGTSGKFIQNTSSATLDDSGNIVTTGGLFGSNLSGTNTGDEPPSTTIVPGILRLATQAETDAGSPGGIAVDPVKLNAWPGSANITTLGTVTTGTWNGTAIEGTAIASTGEAGGTKFLREDGDGTCSWQTISGGGGATAETSIWIDAGAFLGDGTAEASSKTGTNGDVDVFLMANTEMVYAKWSPPAQWDGGTIDVDVYWTCTGATAGHKVKWHVAAQAGGNDDPWDTAFPAPTATADDDVIANGDIHIIEASTITVGGTPADGDVVFFEIERTASGATQMAQEAELLGVRVKYQNSLIQNWYINKLGDETTDATTGVKNTLYMPAAGKIHSVAAGATTATSGGALTLDVHKEGTTIFSTKITIDSGETDTSTAATPAALTTSPTSFAAGDKIEFEVDSTTAGAAGLHADLLISWD